MGGKCGLVIVTGITGMVDYGYGNITEGTFFIDFQELGGFPRKHGSQDEFEVSGCV